MSIHLLTACDEMEPLGTVKTMKQQWKADPAAQYDRAKASGVWC